MHTLVGTALVAASASALNQWLERDTDARMPRTADRPLPAGRLTAAQVVCFSVATIVVGLDLSGACRQVRTTAALGLVTWVLYVWVYTPLKTRTSANTAVGAVAGALPVLMGWTAVGAPLDLRAWALFLIVFIWQFPHFMAIAWIYRATVCGGGLENVAGGRSQRTPCRRSGDRLGAGVDSGQPGAVLVAAGRRDCILRGPCCWGWDNWLARSAFAFS